MNNTELFFDRPWLLLLAIPALLLILIPWLRLPAKRRKSFRQAVPVVLHSLVAVLLVLILAHTAIVRSTDSQAVMLVVDLSDSTAPVQDRIKEHAEQLRELIRKNTPVGVVVFGNDCVYSAELDQTLTPVRTDASDLSAALEYAYTKLPDSRAGRIILLSDGRQTDGNADSTAQYLQSQGIRIDAVYYDTAMLTAEVQLSSFTAPENVYSGSTVNLTVEVESNTFTEGTLSLYDNDALLTTTTVETIVGSKPVELTAQVTDTQPHTYRVVLEPNRDTISQNNEAIAYVAVTDMPSVLVIAGGKANTEPLTQLLQTKNRVTTVEAPKAPRNLPALCDYDGIILANVSTDELPKEYDKLLERYVSDHGRSLLALGGPNTFMYGSMQGTAFEEMMPVRFSLSRSSEDDPVALMLVMDCSLSMSQESTYMSVAKQGAIKCIEAMTDNDYVGIISFNRTAAVEAALAKNTQSHKDSLNRIVSGLTTSQGTYYTDALKLAHEQLLQSQASIKHILFVSDGSPADTSYRELIPQITQDGISISTIGLGYSSSLLESMATSSGGQYYYVSESSELPDIMLTLTEQISVNSLITGDFTPVIAQQTELTQGVDALPSLQGYLGTTIKQGAQAVLTTEEDHPVYATWQYGAGTVSCFTGDLGYDWCSQWLDSTQGNTLILRMAASTLGSVHRDSSMTARFTRQSKTAELTVRTADTREYTLTATVGEKTYTMRQQEPGVYWVSFETPATGIYPVTVTQSETDGDTADTLQTTLAVSWSGEYDAFENQGEKLLGAVCSYSGGMVTDDLQALAAIRVDATAVVFDFMIPFAIVIFIALLADIAIRKLRWKDIKNYWLILKNHKKSRPPA